MFRLLLFAGGFLWLTTACSKDQTEPTIDFGPNNGFTMRTATNMPTGQTDPTDWTTDPTWNDKEQQLFADLHLPLNGPQLPAGTWQQLSYPNPSSYANISTFTIQPNPNSLALPVGGTRVGLFLVDAHYKVQFHYDVELTSAGFSIRPALTPDKYPATNLYRLYYVVYQRDKQVYYKGHGDLKFEE